jgi:nucleoside phosphorylase
MTLLDRLGDVVRAEANAAKDAVASVFRRKGSDPSGEESQPAESAVVERTHTVTIKPGDVAAAMRMLELTGNPTLDQVRTQYRRLAEAGYARAAQQGKSSSSLSWALTEALEVMEQHLLPVA